MYALINKIKNAIVALEKENHPLLICALFLRKDSLEKWDIVVSASWLDSTTMKSYESVVSSLQKHLDKSDFVEISRVVLLNQDDSVVSYLQSLKTITNGGFEELKESELSEKFGFDIKRAYLLRSQKPDSK